MVDYLNIKLIVKCLDFFKRMSTLLIYLGVIHNYQHFHKHTNFTLGGRGLKTMYTFLDVIDVDRTFHFETHFVKKNDYNYKLQERIRKLSWMFSEIIQSTFFVVHFGVGGAGSGKTTFCTLVKILIIVNSPLCNMQNSCHGCKLFFTNS